MQDSSAVLGVKPDKRQNLSELLEEVRKVQNAALICAGGVMLCYSVRRLSYATWWLMSRMFAAKVAKSSRVRLEVLDTLQRFTAERTGAPLSKKKKETANQWMIIQRKASLTS